MSTKDLKIKDFSRSKISPPLPYLLSAQKESWERLWQESLKELFKEMSPIRDYTGKQFEIWFLDYKLGEPKYKTALEAIQNDDSFTAPLRAKVKLVDLQTKDIEQQEIFLADCPLMTEKGTFIINGVERVVIFQLIRSPGAFFTLQTRAGEKYFGAKIIPERGAWLEFQTETSGIIRVRINRKRKIPVTILLKAFGLDSAQDIRKAFQDVDIGQTEYIKKTLADDSTRNQDEALIEVYKCVRAGSRASADIAKEHIENMFHNFRRYDLSKVGRWKTWQRLPELEQIQLKGRRGQKREHGKASITQEDRMLHVEDIVTVVREIIRLNNNPTAHPDQIDHLANRRVRTITEILIGRLRVGLMRVARIAQDRMSTLDSPTLIQLVNARPFMAVLNRFFAASPFSRFMDSENPLAALENKRRLSATGPRGLTRKRAGFEVRDVQPSYYGRICPIETPEGQNIGLVNHLATFARINTMGFIETPYFRVKNGVVTSELQYLNAKQEEQYNIAHAGVSLDEKRRIKSQTVKVRKGGSLDTVDKKQVEFIDVSPQQFLSVAASLIPFLQNDDANRALMGANMQRQAVPLLKPEAPLVSTGMEQRLVRDSGEVIIAEGDGKVEEVDGQHIKIKYIDARRGERERIYYLTTFYRTNQYTCFHQQPRVSKGQKVKNGTLLADGGATEGGRLALGQNVLVAFMPWRGYNFEDAIIISERLVKEDRFTSLYIENFTCDVRETKLGPEVTTADIPNVSQEKLKNLDEEGIVMVGAMVQANDILVGKISPKGKATMTAEERLLQAIFGEKAKEVKDTSLLMMHGKRGRVVRVRIFSREAGDKLEAGIIKRIEVEVAQFREVKVGDKLTGRHGNKGVISKILPEEEMPFTEDGRPVDVILNPLGVISRMNTGQILETHLGWAAKKLNYVAISPSLSGAREEDIKKELVRAGLSQSGKVTLYDGRTGESFPKPVTVGYMYMMKLVHMVEDIVHSRSVGPYSLITQQPLGGKAQFGGQRFGEMEVWALEGYGAAYSLQEMLTIKSDDVLGRAAAYEAIFKGRPIESPNIPASVNLLISEMKSLGLDVNVRAAEGPKNKD